MESFQEAHASCRFGARNRKAVKFKLSIAELRAQRTTVVEFEVLVNREKPVHAA